MALIVPDQVDFKCDLEEGTSQLSTYDNKLEISIDFRAFKRENVRISMAEPGVISVSAVSREKGAADLYHEKIVVPKEEMGRWASLVCKMNQDGVLRITSVPQPHRGQPKQLSPAEPVLQGQKSADSPTLIKSKIQKGRIKTAATAATTSGPQHQEPAQSIQNIFIPKPLDSDFVCDVSLIQSRPEFRVTADKTWRTFVNCTRYKAEDIKVEIIEGSMVRVSKKEEEPGSLRPFLHQIPIPSGCRAQDIEVSFNERGVLRLVAATEESRSEAKKLLLPSTPLLIPIKAKLQAKGQDSLRAKTSVSTPWGQRMASASSKVPAPQPTSFSADSQFRTSIAAPDYKADELEMEVEEGWVTVTGRKAKTSPLAPTTTFTKRIQIPPDLNPESISCGQDAATGMIHISTLSDPPK